MCLPIRSQNEECRCIAVLTEYIFICTRLQTAPKIALSCREGRGWWDGPLVCILEVLTSNIYALISRRAQNA